MESGTIVKWLKSEGDQVEKGEPLYELDTDKVTQEVEAEASGVLLKITVAEGEADVGTTIALIGEQGEDVSAVQAEKAQPVAEAAQEEGSPGAAREQERERGREVTTAEQRTEAEAPAQGNGAGARIKASPLARRIARERGIELGSLKGTGPEGRVVAEDVERAAANALWAEDAIELHPSANVGIAVAIEAGLVVPVIHQAERLTIAKLAAARADIVTRARDDRLRQEDLDGGTFTISNLGMFGVEQFVAVLNPPQAAILAVGAIEPKAVPIETGLEPRPLMTMTLTCDHRSLDGATAADFLRTVKAFLEEPGLML